MSVHGPSNPQIRKPKHPKHTRALPSSYPPTTKCIRPTQPHQPQTNTTQTARWWTRTSCCGTSSGRTTCRGWRTGRSCPSRRSRACCGYVLPAGLHLCACARVRPRAYKQTPHRPTPNNKPPTHIPNTATNPPQPQPFGFFDASPVLDIPPASQRQVLLSTSNHHHGGHNGGSQEDPLPHATAPAPIPLKARL